MKYPLYGQYSPFLQIDKSFQIPKCKIFFNLVFSQLRATVVDNFYIRYLYNLLTHIIDRDLNDAKDAGNEIKYNLSEK